MFGWDQDDSGSCKNFSSCKRHRANQLLADTRKNTFSRKNASNFKTWHMNRGNQNKNCSKQFWANISFFLSLFSFDKFNVLNSKRQSLIFLKSNFPSPYKQKQTSPAYSIYIIKIIGVTYIWQEESRKQKKQGNKNQYY